MKFLPQRWNDSLSVLVLVGVPLLWLFGHLDETLLGGTLAAWTLVVQYYFRKKTAE